MDMSMEVRRAMIDFNHADFSIRKQCDLLNLNRSGLYYDVIGESAYNLQLMRLLDEEYTLHPFKGVLKMVKYLEELNHHVNEKRVRRLLRLMGLHAIYPKRSLSAGNAAHKKYPYLLKGLLIDRPNQVWCTDITYIRLAQGFCYLVAVMDWHSRFVLSWRLSNTLDTSFCSEALEEALMIYGFPGIFNTDQGVQFTSDEFTGTLLANGIKISMDAKGRVFDNIFIERLWRTVKYEEVYLHDYVTIKNGREHLTPYFKFYNFERHHQALEYKTPAEVYFGRKLPVDYVNNVDNSLLVPRKVTHIINVGPQAQLH
jgi:putative transposase